MPDKEDKIAEDIQERFELPPPVHTRNINVDTHLGQAPQRPYALLEDHMASVTSGYRTVDALKAALKAAPTPDGLPDGAPDPNDVVEVNGELVRYVVSQDTKEHFVRDGQVMERVRFTPRYVSLSMEGARVASQEGRETDYWNGFTWLRNGFKPERDFPSMMAAAQSADGEPLVFDQPAASADVAVLHHEMRRADATRPSLPVESGKKG